MKFKYVEMPQVHVSCLLGTTTCDNKCSAKLKEDTLKKLATLIKENRLLKDEIPICTYLCPGYEKRFATSPGTIHIFCVDNLSNYTKQHRSTICPCCKDGIGTLFDGLSQKIVREKLVIQANKEVLQTNQVSSETKQELPQTFSSSLLGLFNTGMLTVGKAIYSVTSSLVSSYQEEKVRECENTNSTSYRNS